MGMPAGGGSSRYETLLKLASGGMATVYVGNVRGALGFRQLVAIKRPHPHLVDDPAFRAELVAEARLASMIRHANVVDVRDVEVDGDQISLIMDYIEGASLGDLLVAAARAGKRLPPRVAVRITLDALAGLHAAHELVDEKDRPVGLVHRDVSPQNILVGTDGTSRVADFGVAKFARKNMQSTSEGSLKGKLAYMPPEYLRGESIDRRFDVFATGIVLWEAITGKRLFRGESEADTLNRVLSADAPPVSSVVPEAAPLDAVVAHALAKNKDERFLNAAAMAAALESSAAAAGLLGSHGEVAATLKELVGQAIAERRELVRSKLANEPSVASLMGVPPIVEAEIAAATQVAPTTIAATPKMGGGAPATMAVPVPPTAPMTAGVPTTQPMTPQMQLAATALDVAPGGTLASAPPIAAPPPRTLASGTLRSDVPPREMAELAFHEASGRSFTGEVPSEEPKKAPARWVVPLVAGLVSAAVASIAIVTVSMRSSSDVKPPPSAPPSASVASAPLAASTPQASASTAPQASASVAPAASSAPAKAQARPTTQPTGPKKPPPNPYQ